MKKTILLSSLFATAAAGLGAFAENAGGVANGVSVESANAVGVLDVSVVAGREQLVAVPFGGYDGGEVTVADIVKTSGLGEGSKLTAVSRSGSTVNSWQLNASGQWEAVVQVKVSNDGTSSETPGDSPATTTISRGDAFWLNPKAAGTAYVLGQQASGAAAVSTSEDWNIVGNPNVEATKVSSILANPKAGDEVVLDDNGKQDRYTYVKDMGWCHRVNGSLKAEEISLDAGAGCWVYVKPAN